MLKLPPKQFERPDMGGWEPCVNGGGGCFRLGRGGERIPVPETVGIWHRTTGWCQDAPYQAGDRLWVRETWCHTGTGVWSVGDTYTALDGKVIFRADDDGRDPGIKWFSPLYLPRNRSRLILGVTEVRVERLQDISEADAYAEGCVFCEECGEAGWVNEGPDGGRQCTAAGCGDDAISVYRDLWNSIHGKDAWDANPWVCAISFRRVLPASHTPVSSDTPTAEGARA